MKGMCSKRLVMVVTFLNLLVLNSVVVYGDIAPDRVISEDVKAGLGIGFFLLLVVVFIAAVIIIRRIVIKKGKNND